MKDAVRSGLLQTQPWHNNISWSQSSTFPNFSLALTCTGKMVYMCAPIYAHPRHMKVLIHFNIYRSNIAVGCSQGWLQPHTTSFGLGLTPIFQNYATTCTCIIRVYLCAHPQHMNVEGEGFFSVSCNFHVRNNYALHPSKAVQAILDGATIVKISTIIFFLLSYFLTSLLYLWYYTTNLKQMQPTLKLGDHGTPPP